MPSQAVAPPLLIHWRTTHSNPGNRNWNFWLHHVFLSDDRTSPKGFKDSIALGVVVHAQHSTSGSSRPNQRCPVNLGNTLCLRHNWMWTVKLPSWIQVLSTSSSINWTFYFSVSAASYFQAVSQASGANYTFSLHVPEVCDRLPLES